MLSEVLMTCFFKNEYFFRKNTSWSGSQTNLEISISKNSKNVDLKNILKENRDLKNREKRDFLRSLKISMSLDFLSEEF